MKINVKVPVQLRDNGEERERGEGPTRATGHPKLLKGRIGGVMMNES